MSRPNKRKPPLPAEVAQYLDALEQQGKDAPLESFGDRVFLKPAGAGDRKALADYLERGFPITSAMRKFLVEILRGKKRSFKYRPKSAFPGTRALEVGGFVELQRRNRARAPIKSAQELFHISRRSVENAARDFAKLNPKQKHFVMMARFGVPPPRAPALTSFEESGAAKAIAATAAKRRKGRK
jgi:hypothetical protein